MDISPLLHALSDNNLVPGNANLGLVEFGNEAFHSIENITFSASNFTMDIESNGKTSHSGSARLESQPHLLIGLITSLILYSAISLDGIL